MNDLELWLDKTGLPIKNEEELLILNNMTIDNNYIFRNENTCYYFIFYNDYTKID